ncbi:MAG: restriction endonuclease subunit S [Dechloromonas sp.]|uniref:Restriction endonuclease subunit S n=1 Tax=Candidatus Dechloromonas phosphorivorans TaxID=2899244 RepID=A0A9D7LKB4_9RHOO|nr:restriction endonuclease subunit S [Candidatus Dechloromonas phosphorivorans]
MTAIPTGYKQTDANSTQGEWVVRDLGAVATLQRGYDLPHRNRKPGSVPVITSSGFGETHSEARVFGPGVVTGRYGTIGEVYLVEEDFWPLNTTLYVKDFHGNDPWFVAYLLRTIDFHSHSGKSGVPGVNRNDLHELAVRLPPLREQRAIAAALSDVDALLAKLDQFIAKKRDLKQAAMQQLLTGQTRLPGFSGEWEVKRLLSLATIAQGQINPSDEPYRSMWLVGPEHVEGRTGKLLNRRTAAEQEAISGKYLFKKGDVVYGKINPYLRKAFLADFDGLCSADMYPLRAVEGVAPGFLLAIILGPEFSRYAESVSMRSGMPKINREEMAGFATLVPKSLEEQTAIATVLSDMDAELAALEARRDKTRALKQGMMQELLTGRIRLI